MRLFCSTLVVATVALVSGGARADGPPADATVAPSPNGDACADKLAALATAATPSAVDVLAGARCQRALKHHAQAAALYDRYLADAPKSDASSSASSTDLDKARAVIESEAAEEKSLALAASGGSGKMLGADPSPGNPFAKSVSREQKPGPAPLWQSPIFWGVAAGVAAAVLVTASIVVVVATTPKGAA